jgi:hypothetical protein
MIALYITIGALIWYSLGVIITILAMKIQTGNVYVNDIPFILVFGLWGPAMLVILLLEILGWLGDRMPNKRLW